MDEELRTIRRRIHWSVRAAIALNIAIPILLWTTAGPPPLFGVGNFLAAGMAFVGERFLSHARSTDG